MKSFILALSLLSLSYIAHCDSALPTTIRARDIKMGLLRPMVRNTTLYKQESANSTCSSTSRGDVHYVTTQGTLNKFSWLLDQTIPKSTCSFRITEDLDQNNDAAYVTLKPVSGKNVNEDGSFLCGEQSLEEGYFAIPSDIDCDTCILEWTLTTPEGFVVKQCADIMVSLGLEKDCLGQCLNGGVCRRGECICKPGYSGDHCENAPGVFSNTFKEVLKIIFYIILSIVLITAVIFLLYKFAEKKISDGQEGQIYHDNKPRGFNRFNDESGVQRGGEVELQPGQNNI